MSNNSRYPRHETLAFLLAAAALLASANATAGQLIDGIYQARSHPYSQDRQYTVYVPDSYDASTPVPLVTVLHGCRQIQQVVFDEQGWHEAADEHGFIVLAPFVTFYEGVRFENCWGWWTDFDYETHQGSGEIEDIHQIALEVERQYNIDPDHRHITGLSAGGFMANIAAVAHNEYWASAAVIEGGGYGETSAAFSFNCPYGAPRSSAGTWKTPQQVWSAMQAELDSDYRIPVLLIHSSNDCTVGHGIEGTEWGGLTANREAWLLNNGGTEYHRESCAGNAVSECTYRKFGHGDSRSTVETISYDGATGTPDGKGHYFASGIKAGEWTRTDGPDTRKIVWAFFARHGRSENAAPEIALIGGSLIRVELDKSFEDPGATATDKEDGDLTARVTTSGVVDTNNAGPYILTYSVTDSDNATTSVQRKVVVYDPSINLAPVISLRGGADIQVERGGTFDDPGAVAEDGEDGDLTHAIRVSGSVDPQTLGTYEIQYSVTDSGTTAGGGSSDPKSASVTRRVTVEIPHYCHVYTSSNYHHVTAGRASVCAMWYACAVGSGDALGVNNIFFTTTLYESPRGNFSTSSCFPGPVESGDGLFVCHTDTNYGHAAAGRAAYGFVFGLGYVYRATGSNDNLGYYGSTAVSLKQTASGFYKRVTICP